MATRQTIAIAAGLTAALMLVACGSGQKPKEANLQTTTAVHAIAFEDGRSQLSPEEYASLNAFMQTVPAGGVSYAGITADDNNLGAVEHAQRIRAYLVKQGVEPGAIHLQPVADDNGESMTLTLEYVKALPPKHCPDWSDDAGSMHDNAMNYSNFGCSYYNNTTVQMENPADYDGSHAAPPAIDATRDSIGIQKYRMAVSAPIGSISASSPSASSGSASGSGSSVSSTGSVGSQ